MSDAVERSPRVVSITAGGAGMFCGSCMRDNALATAARRLGVDVTLVPTFTPIRTDEDDVSADAVWLGGINIYLDHRWPWLGRVPGVLARPLRRLLDRPALLRAVSRRSLQTRRDEDGAIAVSLLRGVEGRHARATRDLVDRLIEDFQPELVNLTNLLITGFVPHLRERLDVPVVATLQGDDLFLDSLSDADRQAALLEMRRIARSIDAFIVFSREYGERMAALFEIPIDRIRTVPLGLASPERFFAGRGETVDRPPTIGYLARIGPEKGFHRLVDAFLRLRARPATSDVRLLVGGWLGASDQAFFDEQLERVRAAGAGEAVTRVDLPDRESKVRMLEQVDVVSVPTVYREPKGLYVLESLAAGVPVVLPAHGAFPELLASTGGGILIAPDPAEKFSDRLAEALSALLLDPSGLRRLGEEGRRGVLARHTADAMARATVSVWKGIWSERRLGGRATLPAGGSE